MKRRSFLKGTFATVTTLVAGKSVSALESPVLPEKVGSPAPPSQPPIPGPAYDLHTAMPWDAYATWTRKDGAQEGMWLKPGEKVTNDMVGANGDAYVTIERQDGEEYSVYLEASPPYRRIVMLDTR